MLAEADLISNQAKSFGNEDPVTVMNAPISLEELTKTQNKWKTNFLYVLRMFHGFTNHQTIETEISLNNNTTAPLYKH